MTKSAGMNGPVLFGVAAIAAAGVLGFAWNLADSNVVSANDEYSVMGEGENNLDVIFIAGMNIVDEDDLSRASMPGQIGDANKGSRLWKRCVACHQIGPDASNRVGPHLNFVFDRQAGTVEGYSYSSDMAQLGAGGLAWSIDTLHTFLTDPKAVVPGTKMNFSGMDDEDERNNLLAFLRQFSDDPANIPEAAATAIPPEVELTPEVLAIVGDRDYGEYLGSECTTCHQRDGTDQGIPNIMGWPTEDFVIAMHAYKLKVRENPVMQLMAARLSDEEIAALAAYFEEF